MESGWIQLDTHGLYGFPGNHTANSLEYLHHGCTGAVQGIVPDYLGGHIA
jgi:hypothetical protein